MHQRMLLGAAGLGLLLGAAPADVENVDGTPAEQAFHQVTDTMMREMAVPMSGDADEDFAMMMIAHHKGAVRMALVELQYGQDAQMRKVAEQIIEDQTREVEDLERWMKDRKPAR